MTCEAESETWKPDHASVHRTESGAVFGCGVSTDGRIARYTSGSLDVLTQLNIPEVGSALAIAAGSFHSVLLGQNGLFTSGNGGGYRLASLLPDNTPTPLPFSSRGLTMLPISCHGVPPSCPACRSWLNDLMQ